MKKVLFLIFSICYFSGWSQIVDDSSKLVYGARTTKIIYEQDLKNNWTKERHPDSTLFRLEKFSELDQRDRKYQNLGNNGTALFPIFYNTPDLIGRTSGFNAYNPYAKTPENLKYYDTKSPLLNLEVVFGGEGRSLVDLAFSRNVNENLNFGFDIYKITSDKQIGKLSQQDRNVVATIFDVYTYYQHPEKPYKAMVNVINNGFNVEETGGIYVADLETATRADLFLYQDSDIRLKDARSSDKKISNHLYHEYNWTKPLQFYHQLDIKRQLVTYQDASESSTTYSTYTDFYKTFLIDEDSTYDRSVWREINNELGIKGDLANLFYRLYLRKRDVDFDMLYQDPTKKFSEVYLGGYTRFDWKEKFDVIGRLELMQSGEYKLNGSLNSDLIFASYQSMRYKPSFLSEKYFGNHHEWNNQFVSSFSNEIKGGINVDLNVIKIKPQVRLLSMDKFFYYDQDMNSRQSSGGAIVSSLGGDLSLKLVTNKTYDEAFCVDTEVWLTNVSGASADEVRIPQAFYNSRIYWRGLWFNHTMGVQIGFNVHGSSAYYAMDYAPELQQFYLQDDFLINRYTTVDFFVNMQVNNVRAFFTWAYLNQGSNNGYFITPYYPGQSQVNGFGVRWMFFD